MPELTARQYQVYTYILTCLDHFGAPPTLQEIAAHLGIKGNLGVLRHLQALEKKGYIERTKAGSRSIRVIGRSTMLTLPVLGAVAAGPLREALQEADEWIQVDASMVRTSDSFVLRVVGDSMIGAHIIDGDLAVIRPQLTAENGEIVVVLIGGEATLKRFYQDAGQIRLQPENPQLEPILVSPSDMAVRILGKVTGIIRTLQR